MLLNFSFETYQNAGFIHVFQWRYCIRLENLGDLSVQLRERHWRIFSLSGTLETVRGRGVVGQEPYLSTDHPAFQYSSHVSLQAPSGHMWCVLNYLKFVLFPFFVFVFGKRLQQGEIIIFSSLKCVDFFNWS